MIHFPAWGPLHRYLLSFSRGSSPFRQSALFLACLEMFLTSFSAVFQLFLYTVDSISFLISGFLFSYHCPLSLFSFTSFLINFEWFTRFLSLSSCFRSTWLYYLFRPVFKTSFSKTSWSSETCFGRSTPVQFKIHCFYSAVRQKAAILLAYGRSWDQRRIQLRRSSWRTPLSCDEEIRSVCPLFYFS